MELSAKLVVLPLKTRRLWAASHSLHCYTVAHATTISCLDFYNDFLNGVIKLKRLLPTTWGPPLLARQPLLTLFLLNSSLPHPSLLSSWFLRSLTVCHTLLGEIIIKPSNPNPSSVLLAHRWHLTSPFTLCTRFQPPAPVWVLPLESIFVEIPLIVIQE